MFYYVTSNGEHPFGKNQISIQANILDYKPQIIASSQATANIEYLSLILKTISKKPKGRPSILKHHIIWSKKTTLQFLAAVRNATDRPLSGSPVAKCIEETSHNKNISPV